MQINSSRKFRIWILKMDPGSAYRSISISAQMDPAMGVSINLGTPNSSIL